MEKPDDTPDDARDEETVTVEESSDRQWRKMKKEVWLKLSATLSIS